jgi:site-specific recombinase XerD
MTSEQLSGFFGNLQKKSNINISAHRFRHRLASDLIKNNNRVKDVQVILGHRDIKSTLAYVTTDINQMRNTLTSLSTI